MNFGKHNVSNRNKFGKESELLMKREVTQSEQ